jgi:hypothetical protein
MFLSHISPPFKNYELDINTTPAAFILLMPKKSASIFFCGALRIQVKGIVQFAFVPRFILYATSAHVTTKGAA